ncbi:MAG: Phenylacetic acid catabolic protein [Candidatus Binataceae bacterium]
MTNAIVQSANGFQVKTCDDLKHQPEEYQTAIRKLVISHAINELYGSRVYDEPAIALAPTPYAKWLTCRVAMEEYGHHVRFFELGREIGIPAAEMLPEETGKKPLTIFSYELKTFVEFCVMKLVGDLAEILQVEDLAHCSFIPLRSVARMTMPEERFHAQYGEDFCKELIKEPDGRDQVQAALDRIYPMLPAFFGRGNSKNNEIYRKWGIKQRTNSEMRADYLLRTRSLVEDRLGLRLPALDEEGASA